MTAKPGHLRDRSAQNNWMDSGEAICALLMVGDLIGKHRSEYRMPQMIVSIISCKEGIQMLNGMIDMFFYRYLGIVTMIEVFIILFGTVLCNTGCCK